MNELMKAKRKEAIEVAKKFMQENGPAPLMKKLKCEGEIMGKIRDMEEKKPLNIFAIDPIFQMQANVGHVWIVKEETMKKVKEMTKTNQGAEFVLKTLQDENIM